MTTLPPSASSTAERSAKGFYWALLGIWIGSLLLRFWGLERFNTLVFDEVYYAKFANNYLTHTAFFDGHPPLSKYLIAIGMWLGDRLPFGAGVGNDLTGSFHKTWSYRWLDALLGSVIPVTIAALTYQLSQRRRFALLAGVFCALDGLFLVESRYALNNVFLDLFGILGQLGLLLAARGDRWRRWAWMVFAGLFFGASASIKWNGLWFLFGAYGIYGFAWILRWLSRKSSQAELESLEVHPIEPSLAQRITQIHPIAILLGLAIVPAIFYYLIWIPHLQQNPGTHFWSLQKQMLAYHMSSAVIGNVHPYCSNWISWLFMLRPVAYFYKVGINPYEVIPLNAPNVEAPPGALIYDVHAMGNPFLWWFSTTAIALLGFSTISRVWGGLRRWMQQRKKPSPNLDPQTEPRSIAGMDRSISFFSSQEFWIAGYLLINYAANLLPWMEISRCAFLYHYMGASLFAMMALAWWCDRAFRFRDRVLARFAWGAIGLSVLGFLWWMPIYLGLPLSAQGYALRMWFRSWI